MYLLFYILGFITPILLAFGINCYIDFIHSKKLD